MAFVYAWIVPSWADQLLPQLEQFDTLPMKCRHIELMHEGKKIFLTNVNYENLDYFSDISFDI